MHIKTVFILLILGCFVGITMLSSFAMGHGADHMHVGCLASTVAGGAPCPNSDILAIAEFYVGAVKSFSLATLSSSLIASLALLFFFLLSLHIAWKVRVGSFSSYQRSLSSFLVEKISLSATPFLRWLALHENSPSFT
ncbi:MAG: hypothetical protein NUV61_03955 [Candidatus Azambacteria bacterium]|nr:hypothetical protein [Candidatus Azambacteria bacterium]